MLTQATSKIYRNTVNIEAHEAARNSLALYLRLGANTIDRITRRVADNEHTARVVTRGLVSQRARLVSSRQVHQEHSARW